MRVINIFLMTLMLCSACKEKDPDPNSNSNNHQKYILKGKILNGTTMQPKYPGLRVTAVVSKTDISGTQTQELGEATMDETGYFEIEYSHSKLAENTLSKLTLRSQFYISPILPKNRDVDTILYESTRGSAYVIFNDIEPSNKTYIIYKSTSGVQFDSMSYGESKSVEFKALMPYVNIFYDTIPMVYDEENEAILGNPMASQIKLTGDPFVDTLRVDN